MEEEKIIGNKEYIYAQANTLNEKRMAIKSFVENLVFQKDEDGNYIYANSLSLGKLSEEEKQLRKEKSNLNNVPKLIEQVLLNYGCVIYDDKDSDSDEIILNIYKYYKEVDYLARHYGKNYISLSRDLQKLKDATEFIDEVLSQDLPKNIRDFVKSHDKPYRCLMDIVCEYEEFILLKEIYFLHYYVERGFEIALDQTICKNIYQNVPEFIEKLKECKDELNENNFRIILHYLKEALVTHRNTTLNMIEKYGYIDRKDFLTDLSKYVKVMKAYQDGKIYEGNIIHDYLISWLDKFNFEECTTINSIEGILVKETPYYTEEDTSIIRLPKSLFRLDEKIEKIDNYIYSLEHLSIHNKKLLYIQEKIAKTILFGIEHLTLDERQGLIEDINMIKSLYEDMTENRYGIFKDNKYLLEKKMLSISELGEALQYLSMESEILNNKYKRVM